MRGSEEAKSILLHSCCGICSGYPITALREMGYEPVVYFYNPNILPEQEYDRRLEAQLALCEHFGCKLIEGKYEPEKFKQVIMGLENEPEGGGKCEKCFKLRLKQTAIVARELEINEFTTSLAISPHKNFDKISAIGEQIAQDYGLNYNSTDFKKNDGFLKTNKISKELNLYRQNYCGCKLL